MGLWEELPVRHRDLGEAVAWEGMAALVTSVGVDEEFDPVDEAGSDAGFLTLTNLKLVIGHLGRLMRKPAVWYTFPLTNVGPLPQHRRGVAFRISGDEPVGFVAAIPAEDPDALRNAVSKVFEERRA